MAIDEKKLIEAITKGEYTTGNILADMELQQFIKDFPKIGEWISCSERLPKETDFPEQKYRILASCSDGIVRNATIENLRDRSKKHFNGSHCEFAYLAWQPLPEPYKE